MLEAAHILGTARSFRGGRARLQVQHGEGNYVVQGMLGDGSGRGSRSVGVQRAVGGDVTLRIAGESVRSVSRLADELPLLLINADSFDLLVGEPAHRRRFLDWGVFHVEHPHRDARQRFQRALNQRNMLLRRGRLDPVELEVWTRDLAVQGEIVSSARAAFMASLDAVFKPLLARLAPEIGEVQLFYRRGWDGQVSYAEALQRGQSSDCDQGFTQAGPQRADVRVTANGHPAAETLSRGQQKLLVTAMKLSQGQLLANRGVRVLFLVDDLPSELDARRCERVCRLLAEMPVQTMITCVDRDAIPVAWLRGEGGRGGDKDVAVFHVEHGEVIQVPAESPAGPGRGHGDTPPGPEFSGETP